MIDGFQDPYDWEAETLADEADHADDELEHERNVQSLHATAPQEINPMLKSDFALETLAFAGHIALKLTLTISVEALDAIPIASRQERKALFIAIIAQIVRGGQCLFAGGRGEMLASIGTALEAIDDIHAEHAAMFS